jgi:hypothetical protein
MRYGSPRLLDISYQIKVAMEYCASPFRAAFSSELGVLFLQSGYAPFERNVVVVGHFNVRRLRHGWCGMKRGITVHSSF